VEAPPPSKPKVDLRESVLSKRKPEPLKDQEEEKSMEN